MNKTIVCTVFLCFPAVGNPGICGYLYSDGSISAVCPIAKRVIVHADVLAWHNHWLDTH